MDPQRSNQHELNGVQALRELLGGSRVTLPAVPWVQLRDSGEHRIEDHLMTWYDSRELNPQRSAEWRLYFDGALDAREGDLLVLIRPEELEQTSCAVAVAGSSWDRQLTALFQIPGAASAGRFVSLEVGAVPDGFGVIVEELFQALGLNEAPAPPAPESLVERALTHFPEGLPAPAVLSSFVRERMPAGPGDPDATLVAWWQAEAGVFLALEGRELDRKLAAGFESADDFLSYSLSLHNRRKSRAGRAFESHLAALFGELDLRFDPHAVTEGNRQPDFLFPGRSEYLDPAFPVERLTMLAAKTTCKDRWRQVLTEARRVPAKHLCTLEPAISGAQLREMYEEQLTLVVPRSIMGTYEPPAGAAPVSIADFVRLVQERQSP